MYNFDRELNKLKLAVRSKRITEDQAKYEVRKLHALAKKFQVPWEADAFVSNDPILVETVQNDVQELYGLHRQGKIKDKHFLRDNAKILALCEEFKFPFPGSKIIADGLTVDFVAVIAEEVEEGPEDEYAGLEFDDVFDDEEAEEEPELQYTYTFGDAEVEVWTEASETVIRISTPEGNFDSYHDGLYEALGKLAPYALEHIEERKKEFEGNPNNPHSEHALRALAEYWGLLRSPETTPEEKGDVMYDFITDGWPIPNA